MTNLEDTKAFADFGKEKFGAIDVLVNNAGVMPLSPLHELKIEEWNRMIDVNIRGGTPLENSPANFEPSSSAVAGTVWRSALAARYTPDEPDPAGQRLLADAQTILARMQRSDSG